MVVELSIIEVVVVTSGRHWHSTCMCKLLMLYVEHMAPLWYKRMFRHHFTTDSYLKRA